MLSGGTGGDTVPPLWPERKRKMKRESGISEKYRETPSSRRRAGPRFNKSFKVFLMDLMEDHWQELEKRGVLPKGK